MKERKVQQMAREAYVLHKATCVVLEAERRELKEMTEEYNYATHERPCEAEALLEEIWEEKRRLDPTGKWDEEEVAIALIEKRKR